MGQVLGYARTSTLYQNLEPQLEALEAAGARFIFREQATGTKADQKTRPQLTALLDGVREGDTVLVTRIDRLARSLPDLLQITKCLADKGVTLRAVEQPFDCDSLTGRLTLGILGVIAEFETGLRAERQAEGIERAKRSGKYRGRPADQAQHKRILALVAEGLNPTEISRHPTISMTRQGISKLLKKHRDAQK
ncbi:recombinase family protein (plasmid) [Formicincola oecophyllae]|uniref:Recombinase family protein n=2 Tax=Formicincola oecophyllae TaxID=2558361 RepID=A0A5B9M8V0_9PROT|nr:recombinase family protein [Formicincola oecophyllae]